MLNSANKSIMGQVMSAKVMSRVPGGFIVQAKNLPNGKGFVPETNQLAMNGEILVKVIGQHQGMPLLHPVFAGFR